MPLSLIEGNNGNPDVSGPREPAKAIVRYCHYGLPKIVNSGGNLANSTLETAVFSGSNSLQPIETTKHPDFVTSRLTRWFKMAPSLQFIGAYPAREYEKILERSSKEKHRS